MTDPTKKRHKLIFEILRMVALCFALSLLLFAAGVTLSRALIEEYCFQHDVYMDEFDWYHLEHTLTAVGFAVSALFFIVLFLALFARRLAYIGRIIHGVHALREGEFSYRVEPEGNNELTELAEAINYLSESQQRVREKERELSAEKETLIRTLSHDIRTPLTSVMSYTQLLAAKGSMTEEEQREYLALVAQKTARIRDLTDILLDGGHRKVEYFEDARLLFEQLAGEFEEALEDRFTLEVSPPSSSAFSGHFDVGELRRILDNLISNIQKYAEPTAAVQLGISPFSGGIVIRQSNTVRRGQMPSESYKMGLYSIRRIAQNYGGGVEVSEDGDRFEIVITLSNI